MTFNSVELHRFFSGTALPWTEDGSYIELSRRSLPPPPGMLTTQELCLTRYRHFYGDFPVDHVHLEGGKSALRDLGLLLFSAALHAIPYRVSLNLLHSRSTIRKLIVNPLASGDALPGLQLVPTQFNYYPAQVNRHPWLHHGLRPADLPVLYLTNGREELNTLQDLEERDVAVGFGGMEGTCRFAELLLNAGSSSNAQNEFALECEIGFRGVGPGSAEISIWLPGSIGNMDVKYE